jgi:hypothetical protein
LIHMSLSNSTFTSAPSSVSQFFFSLALSSARNSFLLSARCDSFSPTTKLQEGGEKSFAHFGCFSSLSFPTRDFFFLYAFFRQRSATFSDVSYFFCLSPSFFGRLKSFCLLNRALKNVFGPAPIETGNKRVAEQTNTHEIERSQERETPTTKTAREKQKSDSKTRTDIDSVSFPFCRCLV